MELIIRNLKYKKMKRAMSVKPFKQEPDDRGEFHVVTKNN